MSELFGADVDVAAFSLPGDDAYTQPPAEAATAVEDPPAEKTKEQPRNDLGQFTTPETPEAAPADDAAPAGEDEPSQLARLMATKSWTDAEQVAAGYLNAEQELGRLRNELGQLARERDALMQQQQPAQPQQQQVQPQYDNYQLQEWAAGLPPTQIPLVAQQAFEQGNDQVMLAAVDAWREVDKAGADAFQWNASTVRAAAIANLQQQWATENRDAQVQTAEQFVTNHPDFEPLVPTMQQIATEGGNEYIRPLLASQDPQARLAGVTILYEKARDRTQSANLTDRSREIAMEHAKQAEQAIKDAAVVSTTAPAAAPNLSLSEAIGGEWDKLNAPIRDGWNI